MDGELTAEEVHDLLANDDPPVVVDIRNPPAFARGRVPGSINIPFSQLPARVAELEDAEYIVTVCPHGKASVQAARLIGSYEGTADARIVSMSDGLDGWTWELETDGEAAEADEGPQSPF